MFTILSVGGSIIIPKTGFDIKFLKQFRQLILARLKMGEKFILVIGGGATCRNYQAAAKEVVKMSAADLDWLGIYTTQFNAEFVRLLFKDVAHNQIINNPSRKIKTNASLIIAAGYEPGHSTDMDAVLLAKTYGARRIFNLSNIDYLYDRDPNKFKTAQKIEQIDWTTFRQKIVGHTWVPGKNAPFDPIASALAQKLKFSVSLLNGTNLKNLSAALNNKKFIGTIIEN